MFGFGKSKELDKKLYAPVSGEVIELSSVSDPVFSQKMMGDGFAVNPDAQEGIYAPVSGEVVMVQGHAFGFKTGAGAEILLHVGIDTVNLEGKPFTSTVKAGDTVTAGDKIGTVDWAQVEAAGLEKTTMVVVTGGGQDSPLAINLGQKAAGEAVATL